MESLELILLTSNLADSFAYLAWLGYILSLSALLFVSLTVCLWIFLEISCIDYETCRSLSYSLLLSQSPVEVLSRDYAV